MDTRLLEAFLAVVEHGSVTHAAALAGVTQPAVSAQIARLEEEVGFPLFERIGNRLRPTAQGRAFLSEAERTLRAVEGLERTAESIREGRAGSLSIICHPSAGVSLLPPVVARFAQSRPGLHARLFTRNSDVVRSLFPSGLYDIGVAEPPIDPAGLSITRYRMPCVLIAPQDHPLRAHKHVTPALLSGEPFIAINRQGATHHRVISMFAEHGANCAIVAEAEMFATICGMVANGLGVSIIDPATAAEFEPLGLCVRPLEPVVFYEIAVFHAADREPSLITREFLAALDQHVSRFSDPPRANK